MNEEILLSYLKGELGEEEAMKVELWCEEAQENRKTLEQLYYVKFVGDRVSVMQSVDSVASFAKLKTLIKQKEAAPRRVRSIWRRYAVPVAAFITGIIFAVGFSFLALNKSSDYIVATTAGQRAQFVLPDGSKVWLNASTRLTYKTSLWSSARQVDLSGEAYFDVSRNESPFIVSSKDIQTRVLGTRFNVRARAAEEKVVTTLLKGSVRVDLPVDKGEGFILKPGQSLNVNTRTLQTELTESSSAQNVLLWIKGRLDFEQAPFADIANCLEQHFDIHFHFADKELRNERFTATFHTDDDITEILSVLSLTKHFEYKKEGRDVSLSLKK